MNILVLTSIYPQEDDEKDAGVTPVVKYFATEWAKAGHEVLVIHNASMYPRLLYLLPNSWLKKINAWLGIVIPNKEQRKKLKSISNGVRCYRIPMLKFIPKNKYTDLQIKKQFNKIINVLKDERFSPDIILGHWENPQIQLLSMLKRKFNVRTAIVLHALVYINQRRYKKWAQKYMKEIDVIGARSKAIANQAKELLSLEKEPFICYSGIPDKYFDNEKYKIINLKDKLENSYLFVGRLIKRKNVDVCISALKKVYKKEKFLFNIVGEGAEREYLETIVKKYKLEKCVKFLGYKQREEVLDVMNQTQVFIMISNNETFGLVYIEAMSRGCLVIASKNGGMDGIIKHGYNGFLCEQGNESELEEILNAINELSLEEKLTISKNAIKTAYSFKDSEVAKKYLGHVIGDY